MTPHNGETLAAVVVDISQIWRSTNTILCVNTEKEDDVVKRLRLLRYARKWCFTESFHVRCISYVMNRAIIEAFRDIHREANNIRKLFGAVKSSVKDAFQEFKNSLKMHNLVISNSDMDARWNSTFNMIQEA